MKDGAANSHNSNGALFESLNSMACTVQAGRNQDGVSPALGIDNPNP